MDWFKVFLNRPQVASAILWLRKKSDGLFSWIKRNASIITLVLVLWGFFYGTPWEVRNLDEKYQGVLSFRLDKKNRRMFADMTNPDAKTVWVTIDWPKRCLDRKSAGPTQTRFYGNSLSTEGFSYADLEDCARGWVMPMSLTGKLKALEGMIYPIFVDVHYLVHGKTKGSHDMYVLTTSFSAGSEKPQATKGDFRIESISYLREQTRTEKAIEQGAEEVDRKWARILDVLFGEGIGAESLSGLLDSEQLTN